MADAIETRFLELGDFALQKGSVLPDARLAYATLGELAPGRDNVVLCPTWFTASPADVAAVMTGPGRALDPERFFIVIPAHFGAGLSSSPSTAPPPFERGRFPRVTTYDNVAAQRVLLAELGVERIRLASSWSMGACQVYAWGALHSEMIDAIAPIAGSARTGEFNKVFLAGNRRAIESDPDWNDGFYGDKPPIRGVRTMAAIYAGWGFSEPFFRERRYREFGAASVDEFIELYWEAFLVKADANDLLAQMWTWWHNDVGDHPRFGGDTDAALAAITARAIVLPGSTDAYFPPVDSEYEASRMPNAECRPVPTIWGHMCVLNPPDQEFIDAALRELLDRPARTSPL